MADDQAPDEGQEPAEAVVGQPHRPGWYRSTSGAVAHADGPSQVRAYADRGWAPIGEDEARQIIAAAVDLRVDPGDTAGTFDADAVDRAVRDEAPTPRRKRGS